MNDSNDEYYTQSDDDGDDDKFAGEVGRINSCSERENNFVSDKRITDEREYFLHSGSTAADMEEFARQVLTPRPLSVDPSVNVEVDDAYFTPAERREYEQDIPFTHTSPPGWGADLFNSIRWRRGELLGCGYSTCSRGHNYSGRIVSGGRRYR